MLQGEWSIFVTRVVVGIIAGSLFWGVYFFMPAFYFALLLGIIVAIIALFEWKNIYDPHTRWFWLMFPIYPLMPFVLLIYLSLVPAYNILLLYLFVLAFAHDTGAYIVGTLLGRHKIWPSVSPKKTWEGVAGGLVATVVSLYILFTSRSVPLSWSFTLGCTGIASFLFVTGDLIESRFKRRVGIKDSGHLLPGHGGLLDRFDGIMFAAFFVYLFRDYAVCFLK